MSIAGIDPSNNSDIFEQEWEHLIREHLRYDPDTGLFWWIKRLGSRVQFGKPAGSLNDQGYVIINFYRRRHRAHRLAWWFAYEKWAADEIDHKNGIRTDNRINNLREVTRTVNSQNMRNAHKDNKSKTLGVFRDRARWSARIRVNGISIHLGCFASSEEAHAAYLKAKRDLHIGCTI